MDRALAPYFEKPRNLAAWLVPFGPEGGTVLDPFMGGGTLLHGARAMGRQVIGGDIEEAWCEVAADGFRQGRLDFDRKEAAG